MPELPPVVDHVIINVADQLDEASTLFRRLGFQLSERGHHTMGSSNHLAIFGETYLELLGYEPETGKDFCQSPLGLSGLVWKTSDADAVYQHLQQQQLDGDTPASFSRPVTLPDGSQIEARFRIARLRADAIANGVSFFCQHLTPEAVWQPAWRKHRNGVVEIAEFVIAAERPEDAAAVYRRLFDSAVLTSGTNGELSLQAGQTRVRFLSAEAARAEFGALPSDYDGQPRMAALSFKTRSLDQTRQSLLAGNLPFVENENGIQVPTEAGFNLALRFRT
ncbi:VOC family protein [Lonsdalea britannica]|uniref:VOC family protein n=1 Tax=Lonsdalea britannica TaxID=1082704 RepID=UPI0026EAA1C7|nr:VOC family protein [Lonsdalea britannica]